MAENAIRVDGLVMLDDSTTAPLFTSAVANPLIKGAYVYSLGNITGVVAANNYISLFNPVGSGKSVFFGAAYASVSASAAISSTEPLNLFRVTTATVGTLQAAAAIGKFQTVMADALAEVRIGNPTVTLGAQLANVPAIVANPGSMPVHAVTIPPGAPPFILAPGEGVALRSAAGNANQRWNLSIVWSET